MGETSTAKPASATASVTTRDRVPRRPKAAQLLVYIEEYIAANDIGVDASLNNVISSLEASIVAEAKKAIN